jgi:nucleotide-binding universal stress UspA family protein
MSYKTIIVHIDAGKRRRERLDLAFRLAEDFDAHLIGLFALEPFHIPPTPEAAPVLMEIERKRREEASAEAKKEFLEKARLEQWEKSEWRETWESLSAVRLHARYADLVIVGQPNGKNGDDEGAVPEWFSHELVMSAGRPVLFVPYAGHFEHVGERVFVPWNASREAARAVWDGLPFLAAAKESEVVTFDPEKLGLGVSDLPDPDIGADLARHGARVTVSSSPSGGVDVGSLILSRAADMAADLIVMGAYGHSRLREVVLGGATRKMLESMTVPTLMSH